MTAPTALPVSKTAKLYIGGEFVRSESGRSYQIYVNGTFVNIPRATRKDVRNAVRFARQAQAAWAARTAYNRGQILYRMAEMISARRIEFQSLVAARPDDSESLVNFAIDGLLFFAGAADKLTQLGGNVNQVAGPFFNFSIPEPIGVVAILPPTEPLLAELLATIAATIASGNTCVVVLDQNHPLPGLLLGEILATSDLPAGVVNLLSGYRFELLPTISSHRDIDAVTHSQLEPSELTTLEAAAADSVKRIVPVRLLDSDLPSIINPDLLLQLAEIKTVWHPVGQ